MDRIRFGPERILALPVLIAFLGSLPAAASAPYLAWLVLLPVAAGVWVFRAKVLADAEALVVCNGLRSRRFTWREVTGFDVPRRGPVRLLLGERRVVLTAVPRRQLRALMAIGSASA